MEFPCKQVLGARLLVPRDVIGFTNEDHADACYCSASLAVSRTMRLGSWLARRVRTCRTASSVAKLPSTSAPISRSAAEGEPANPSARSRAAGCSILQRARRAVRRTLGEPPWTREMIVPGSARPRATKSASAASVTSDPSSLPTNAATAAMAREPSSTIALKAASPALGCPESLRTSSRMYVSTRATSGSRGGVGAATSIRNTCFPSAAIAVACAVAGCLPSAAIAVAGCPRQAMPLMWGSPSLYDPTPPRTRGHARRVQSTR